MDNEAQPSSEEKSLDSPEEEELNVKDIERDVLQQEEEEPVARQRPPPAQQLQVAFM